MNALKTSSSKPKIAFKYVAVITVRGLLIRKSDFDKLLDFCGRRQAMEKLVVSHNIFVGKEKYTKSLPLYREITATGSAFYLLAHFIDLTQLHELAEKAGINASVKYVNKIPPGEDITIAKFEPGIDLLENQQVAFDFLVANIYSPERIDSGFASCILVMATGLGKTYMGGAFIEFCKKKTLVIIQNTSPITEWINMLEENFPLLDIGQYHSQSPKLDGDVVIMTIDSALGNEFKWSVKKKGQRRQERITMPYYEYFQLFGAIIFDEIHNYPTPKRQEIFWRTNFQRALGLTATPDERTDGMDSVVEKHIGHIIRATEIPGFTTKEVKWIGKVNAIKYRGPPEFTVKYNNRKGWADTQKMCEQFMSDPYRNQLLLQEIKKLYDKGKNIFIFSERRAYLHTLQATLVKNGFLSEMPEDAKQQDEHQNNVQTLMGGSTQDEKTKARDHARIILITYGYGKESISIPKMNAIIFATPRRNKMTQTLGRILRISGDPKIPRIIIDIIDESTSLASQFNTRKKVYKDKDFPIKEKIISYEDISIIEN
jgi:superfamily II DNA or RNA helicase